MDDSRDFRTEQLPHCRNFFSEIENASMPVRSNYHSQCIYDCTRFNVKIMLPGKSNISSVHASPTNESPLESCNNEACDISLSKHIAVPKQQDTHALILAASHIQHSVSTFQFRIIPRVFHKIAVFPDHPTGLSVNPVSNVTTWSKFEMTRSLTKPQSAFIESVNSQASLS